MGLGIETQSGDVSASKDPCTRYVSELDDEKIDLVEWSEDPNVFIANALGRVVVKRVELNEANKSARVIVPDNQLSLAIGQRGQNARLAAKLTGWKVDIKGESEDTVSIDELFKSMILKQTTDSLMKTHTKINKNNPMPTQHIQQMLKM